MRIRPDMPLFQQEEIMTVTNVKGEPLVKRELEIIHLLPKSKGVRQMARELGVSLGTLRWHLKKINRKLGTNGQLEIVVRCIELGILEIPRIKEPADNG